MERNLELIKKELPGAEKRTFPRFPFSYLTFRSNQNECQHALEVKDISETGMQLALIDGDHSFSQKQEIEGKLHWGESEVEVTGQIKWIWKNRVGVAFEQEGSKAKLLGQFLSTDNVIKELKPLHDIEMDLEKPLDLKYWLRADGPVEIFMWMHQNRELSHFEIILFNKFVDWKDGEGVRTGKVLTKRDVDSPLLTEDEFVFEIDPEVDRSKLDQVQKLVDGLGPDLLPEEALDFLRLKLNH